MSSANQTDTEEQTDNTPHVDVIAASDTLDVVIDALGAANNETVLTFTPAGMRANAVDDGNVLMADVYAPADAFESYDVAGEVIVGTYLSKLENFGTVGSVTNLSYEPETAKFGIQSGPSTVSAASLDPDSISTKELSDDMYDQMKAQWAMPVSDLKTALGVTTEMRGEVVEILASPGDPESGEPIRVRKDGDNDTATIAFDDAEWADEPADTQRVLMSEGYLQAIVRAVPSTSTEIEMWTKSDFPLLVGYESEGVDVSFLQAPRLES